jgi:hypothetical protein
MECANHPETGAVGTCSSCGKAICEGCRSEVDEKNYCPNCLEDKATSRSITQIYQDNNEYLWSAVAIISTFLPWATIEFGLGTRALLGLEIDIGILYLLIAVGSIWIIRKWEGSKKRKGLLSSGVLMAMVATSSLYYMISTFAEQEQELSDNPFSELVNTEIGVGLYLAFAVSVIIIYQGYKTGLSLDAPFNPSKYIKYALVGINGLLAIVAVISMIAIADVDGRTVQFFSYVLALIAFGGVTYFSLRSTSRERIVQFSLLGIFAVLILSVALVDFLVNEFGRFHIRSFFIFVVLPILPLSFNLWAVEPESNSVDEISSDEGTPQ